MRFPLNLERWLLWKIHLLHVVLRVVHSSQGSFSIRILDLIDSLWQFGSWCDSGQCQTVEGLRTVKLSSYTYLSKYILSFKTQQPLKEIFGIVFLVTHSLIYLAVFNMLMLFVHFSNYVYILAVLLPSRSSSYISNCSLLDFSGVCEICTSDALMDDLRHIHAVLLASGYSENFIVCQPEERPSIERQLTCQRKAVFVELHTIQRRPNNAIDSSNT